jgi:gamma-butyrobetaine dioxygenase
VRYWLDGAQRHAREDCAWLSHSDYDQDAAQTAVWLRRLVTEGIAFISAVPTHEGAILSAVAPMGHVIDTNYGRLFDVRAVPLAENLAYTDRGLGLHTDNPYRDPVPGFQALHCLHASREGGDSLFADGWAVAEHLRATDPDSFATLTTTAVPFYYRSAKAELRAERPLIQLTARGVVSAVHYNNRSIAPLQLNTSQLQRFYRAYQRLALLLREPRFQMHLRLRPGDLVVFDNQRILHGRTAFVSMHEARHLQGCYLSRDSVFSTAAILNRM